MPAALRWRAKVAVSTWGLDRSAELVAEHEIAIVIRLPSEATLELLRLTVLANGIDHHAIERDRAL